MESVAAKESVRFDLRERGKKRVEQFRWANTARATLEAYRSAVLKPSPRSLQMRRNLREGILRWAAPLTTRGYCPPSRQSMSQWRQNRRAFASPPELWESP